METWCRDAERVLGAAGRWVRRPAVVVLRPAGWQQIESQFGGGGLDELVSEMASRVGRELAPGEQIGRSAEGTVMLLLRDTAVRKVPLRLDRIIGHFTGSTLPIGRQRLHVTPAIGWVRAGRAADGRDVAVLLDRASQSAAVAAQQLDLVPRRWSPDMSSERKPAVLNPARVGLQVLATLVLGLLVPFLVLLEFDRAGVPVVGAVYVGVCLGLAATAAMIWTESLYALDPERPPKQPAAPYPAASAVIAAYLPNEASTIVETVRVFLAMDYPGPLQVVLAYNTPHGLPVEAELCAMAESDPRFVLLRVSQSTSKAQNINAALQVVTGEFVGVFDADHHPDPGAFRRAWRWISHGADVVQGHCLIRNGHESWVARMVAVEFESIYAVSHPGRAKLHGFGLFGGSNGFWRACLLREIRMRRDMLTEDIDSSIRALLQGSKVVHDPGLVSRELAPTTLATLWNQRMRWAQGWFQVSHRHLLSALSSVELSGRNKIGLCYLLGWREIYPWMSPQIFSVLASIAWRDGATAIDWGVSIFALTSLYTLSVGPAQALFAYRLAAPEVREHKRWFWFYLVVATFFYTPLKNVIARVAQIKEFCGERRWVVTPRAVAQSQLAGEEA